MTFFLVFYVSHQMFVYFVSRKELIAFFEVFYFHKWKDNISYIYIYAGPDLMSSSNRSGKRVGRSQSLCTQHSYSTRQRLKSTNPRSICPDRHINLRLVMRIYPIKGFFQLIMNNKFALHYFNIFSIVTIRSPAIETREIQGSSDRVVPGSFEPKGSRSPSANHRRGSGSPSANHRRGSGSPSANPNRSNTTRLQRLL